MLSGNMAIRIRPTLIAGIIGLKSESASISGCVMKRFRAKAAIPIPAKKKDWAKASEPESIMPNTAWEKPQQMLIRINAKNTLVLENGSRSKVIDAGSRRGSLRASDNITAETTGSKEVNMMVNSIGNARMMKKSTKANA